MCDECAPLQTRVEVLEAEVHELVESLASVRTVITSMGTVAGTLQTVPFTQDE